MPLKDEYREKRESIKDKPFKEKLDYFWYYYKLHTCIGLFVLIVGIFLIVDVAKAKDYVYTCTFVNANPVNEETGFMDAFAATTDVDLSKHNVYLDDSVHFSTESYDQTSMAMMQKFASMIYVGEIDNLIMEKNLFATYAENQAFLDLRTVLTEEEINKYKDHFFYVDFDNLGNEEPDYEAIYQGNQAVLNEDSKDRRGAEGMTNPVPVGIFLDDELRDRLDTCGFYPEDEEIVFGFLTETHIDLSHQFLKWLTCNE